MRKAGACRRFPCHAVRLPLVAAAGAVALAACVQRTTPAESVGPPIPVLGGADQLDLEAEPPADPGSIAIEPAELDRSGGMSELRTNALREAAMGLGSQHAFRRRAWEINRRLEERSAALSSVYDFNRVASSSPGVPGYVLPPVVGKALDAYSLGDEGRSAAHAEEVYDLLKPARLSPVIPTWRDYLVIDARVPREPPSGLRPRSGKERGRYRDWFDEGWRSGLAQADAEFRLRLERLRRDFEGMLEYRRLASLGMVFEPTIESGMEPVAGSEDAMRIAVRQVRIAGGSEFNLDSSQWRDSGGSEDAGTRPPGICDAAADLTSESLCGGNPDRP